MEGKAPGAREEARGPHNATPGMRRGLAPRSAKVGEGHTTACGPAARRKGPPGLRRKQVTEMEGRTARRSGLRRTSAKDGGGRQGRARLWEAEALQDQRGRCPARRRKPLSRERNVTPSENDRHKRKGLLVPTNREVRSSGGKKLAQDASDIAGF